MSHILVLNAGSSSLKIGLFEAEASDPILRASGLVDRIGAGATITLKATDGARIRNEPLSADDAKDHAGALAAALTAINTAFPNAQITRVGHRVVHGGMNYSTPVEITDTVISELRALEPFAPLHQPHNLAGIRAAQTAFPDAQQVACFDTAFHRGHPLTTDTFGLPRSYYEKGIRRYGFHGLSYDYIAGYMSEHWPQLHAGRVVVAHLGNGASLCAIKGGHSVASTMGFSALDGIPMGTRTGALDPGVVLYLIEQEGLSAGELVDLLYKRSGLLGLSGESADMRTLLASDNPHADEAITYFCRRIRREIGALAAEMGGLDAIIFTGGIGENAAPIRARVCREMEWLEVSLDDSRNDQGNGKIHTQTSRVAIHVIPTNEELVIARAAMALRSG